MQRAKDIPMGWPRPKRKKLFDDLTSSPAAATHRLVFRKEALNFPIYRVPIDLPKYRLANGRTQAAQEEYVAKNGLPLTYFATDQESETVLRVQHELLWEMVKSTELFDYFQDHAHTQDEPLILSREGFVVNGNRRLCAMRELYYSDKDKYPHFEYVDIILLPPCIEKDLDELEARLQIQPDIKQDYTWIAMSCMLRARQQHYAYLDDDLARLYALDVKDVQTRLALLGLVDQYLESRGKSRQYDLVVKSEFAFAKLKRGRSQLKQPDKRDLFTELTFCLIDAGTQAGGRLYERVPEVLDHLDDLAGRLKKELNVSEGGSQQPDLGIDILGGTLSSDYAALSQAVSQPDSRDEVIEVLIDTLDEHKAIEAIQAKSNAVLKYLSQANAYLRNAVDSLDADTARQGLTEQLTAIEQSVQMLRQWLEKHAEASLSK